MKTTFTPGPWTFRDESGAGLQIYATVNLGHDEYGNGLQPVYHVACPAQLTVLDNGQCRAMIAYEGWRQFPTVNFEEMQKSNARLIAVAPEMFDMLKAELKEWDCQNFLQPSEQVRVDRLRALIAKAGKAAT